MVELLMVELLSALEVELLMDGMGELLLELVMLVLVMAKLLSELMMVELLMVEL